MQTGSGKQLRRRPPIMMMNRVWVDLAFITMQLRNTLAVFLQGLYQDWSPQLTSLLMIDPVKIRLRANILVLLRSYPRVRARDLRSRVLGKPSSVRPKKEENKRSSLSTSDWMLTPTRVGREEKNSIYSSRMTQSFWKSNRNL